MSFRTMLHHCFFTSTKHRKSPPNHSASHTKTNHGSWVDLASVRRLPRSLRIIIELWWYKASFYSWMTVNRPIAEQTSLLSMGDKTKRSCFLLTVFFGGLFFFFLFIISIFVFHNICNISQQQTTPSYATGGSEQSKTNILCTPLRRVDKRISIVGSG